MTERPIEHGVDGLQEARDQAAREVDRVATQAKAATDGITRMVEEAKVRRGAESPCRRGGGSRSSHPGRAWHAR